MNLKITKYLILRLNLYTFIVIVAITRIYVLKCFKSAFNWLLLPTERVIVVQSLVLNHAANVHIALLFSVESFVFLHLQRTLCYNNWIIIIEIIHRLKS